jgi:hypothetical protein
LLKGEILDLLVDLLSNGRDLCVVPRTEGWLSSQCAKGPQQCLEVDVTGSTGEVLDSTTGNNDNIATNR